MTASWLCLLDILVKIQIVKIQSSFQFRHIHLRGVIKKAFRPLSQKQIWYYFTFKYLISERPETFLIFLLFFFYFFLLLLLPWQPHCLLKLAVICKFVAISIFVSKIETFILSTIWILKLNTKLAVVLVCTYVLQMCNS